MTNTGYYNILNLNPNSTPGEIKKSYLKLSRQYHPDKNNTKEAEEKFKEISKVYQVLSDPEKRKLYDKFGEDFEKINSMQQQDPFGGMFGNFGFNFGGGNQVRKSSPISINLIVTLKDLYEGVSKKFKFQRKIPCKICEGSGLDVGKTHNICNSCKGSGKTVIINRNGNMIQQNISICFTCKGAGKSINKADLCKHCIGNRISIESIEKEIDIPKGIEIGNTIRMENVGNLEPDTDIPGDLDINMIIETPHPFLERKGKDILFSAKVNLYDALNEYEISFEHLNGKKYLLEGNGRDNVLKPGNYVLKNLGFPIMKSNKFGNLIIQVEILFPDKIDLSTNQQKKLRNMFKYDQLDKKDYLSDDFTKIPFPLLKESDNNEELYENEEECVNERNQGQCVHQ